MLPLYNQELFVALKATIEADSIRAGSTVIDCHYKWGSTAAMTASTYVGAGGHLSYVAYDPPTGVIKLLYAGDS